MIALASIAFAATPDDAALAEARGDYEQAVALCREPPTTPGCDRRVARLERRRDPDGTFGSWSRLEAVRRAVRLSDPEAAQQTVSEVWAARSTPDAVRAEAAIWLADRALREDPGSVVLRTQPWIGREVADEPELTARIRALAIEALREIGDDEEAHELDPIAPRPPERTARWPWIGVGIAAVGALAAWMRRHHSK